MLVGLRCVWGRALEAALLPVVEAVKRLRDRDRVQERSMQIQSMPKVYQSALTSGQLGQGKRVKTGEVFYIFISISNASRTARQDGSS